KSAGRRAVDKGIENICLKALEKNPANRYPNAKALADDLNRWLIGEAVEASTPSRGSRTLLTSVVAAAVIAIVVVGGFFGFSWDPAGKAEGQRKNRADESIVQGGRLLAQRKFADALYAFRRALEIAPANEAAAAGRVEAERRMVASAVANSPVEKPAPSAPPS